MFAGKAGRRLVGAGVVALVWVSGTSGARAVQAGASVPSTLRSAAAGESRYIVVFKRPAAIDAIRSARAGAQARGGQVHFDYQSVLNGFAATLPAPAVEALQRNPNVERIEPDTTVTAAVTQVGAPWGLDRIDQRALPLDSSYGYTANGSGVKAYIVDSGVRASHTQFGGRVTTGYTAISDGRGTDDCAGHGTHVAGILGGSTYGVAKAVELVPVRVLGCDGSGFTSGVIAGIDWVTSNHQAGQPAVANLSVGSPPSPSLDTAVANSILDGVTYAVAAGNETANACDASPSRVDAAITVGATTANDARADYSNFGTCVDLFAPGSSIPSAWFTGDTATNTVSGTSMATPHVAGAAAVYLQANPSAPPSAVRDAIVNSATRNVVTNAMAGSPNRLLYSAFGAATAGAPCSLPESYTRSFARSGAFAYFPPGMYAFFYAGAGTHQGCLRGPAGADFNLSLQMWNGSSWATVAQGTTSSADEDVTYAGGPGYYTWKVEAYAGSGPFTFAMKRPA